MVGGLIGPVGAWPGLECAHLTGVVVGKVESEYAYYAGVHYYICRNSQFMFKITTL